MHPPPDILARVERLELHARRIVDGYLAGMHRSPQHGFAVEFAQHRDYVPGDDIRHVDWKVFGRTGRFFLKQYELETNLVLWLLVDGSESMRFASGSIAKYDYASMLAAALAHLALRQSDAFSLCVFDASIRAPMKPSSQPNRLREALRLLAEGPGGRPSRIGPVLHQLSETATRRGVVVLFSDLLDDPDEILAGLRHLRFLKHDVAIFHIMDPAELDFPFRQATLFKGLEDLPDVLTDPLAVRESYLEELSKFLNILETGCRTLEVDYVRLPTDREPGEALAAYLSGRGNG